MQLTPDLLLRAYALGIFPMAESRDDPNLHWIEPEMRGILPLDSFHIPKKLRRRLRRGDFHVTSNTAFARIIRGCAEPQDNRPETWINETIEQLYIELHTMGFAHSIEVWQENGRDLSLVGGLYGVSLGAAFFGESMFSRATDASKTALVHLMLRLHYNGFQLLDTQFTTPHLRQFGAMDIPRENYKALLGAALSSHADFPGNITHQELMDTMDHILEHNRTQK